MDVKMMKAAELAHAIARADDECWRCEELLDLRREEQAEDRSMRYVNDLEYDQEIEELEDGVERAARRLCDLEDEMERRRHLSNHALLAEMHMRGEVPA